MSSSSYPEKPAALQHPIHELLARRWSPRVFEKGRQVEHEKLESLLEAARWAPSCFNDQPWRYLIWDGSDANAREKANSCLAAGNAWALDAPLLMLSVARLTFSHNGKPNRTAPHDVGLASENLVLQAVALGLVAHQMAGYDMARARSEFNIPEGFEPMAMIAVGYPNRDLESLPSDARAKEEATRTRLTISEIAFAGTWGNGVVED